MTLTRQVLPTLLFFTLLCTCGPALQHPEGQAAAERYCGSCHLVPTPTDLTKDIWISEVLPHMAALNGIYVSQPRADYLRKDSAVLAGVYPLAPRIDSASWSLLQRYFIDNAPNELPPPASPLRVRKMDQFQVHTVTDLKADPPTRTTAIAFDELTGRVSIGGQASAGRGMVAEYDLSGEQRRRYGPFHSPPSAIYPRSNQALIIGSLVPSDGFMGRLVGLDSDTVSSQSERLQRPLDMLQIDLNLDGQVDTIVAEYGNMTGRLRLLSGKLEEVLVPTPGAIKLLAADLNLDGHDDLVTLFAQGDERITVTYAGMPPLRTEVLYRFPATYGSADLAAADMDGDGDLDLIHVAGDNFDYQPIGKPYHGVRVLRNDGAAGFTESWFQAMDGAYGVEVFDFDGDGDQDIAAVAYFVPPALRSTNSFAYFQQDSPGNYRAYGFHKPIDHHYICMTRADVDADGDEDLLLGNYGVYLPDGERRFGSRKLEPFVWLENKTSSK